MFKVTPNPPVSTDPQLAAEQACAHYQLPPDYDLPGARSTIEPVQAGVIEEVLVDVCDILESASATAYESADHLQGPQRKLAMAVVRLIDLARNRVDDTLRDGSTG